MRRTDFRRICCTFYDKLFIIFCFSILIIWRLWYLGMWHSIYFYICFLESGLVLKAYGCFKRNLSKKVGWIKLSSSFLSFSFSVGCLAAFSCLWYIYIISIELEKQVYFFSGKYMGMYRMFPYLLLMKPLDNISQTQKIVLKSSMVGLWCFNSLFNLS